MITGRRRGIFFAVFTLTTSAACNWILGIEEQGPRPDPAAPQDGRSEARDRCAIDDDCTPPSGCYRGRCDKITGACNYALCESKDRSCAAATCNASTGQCENERSYGFRTTHYPLGDIALGCGKDASACVAAAFPFLFVATRTEVIALVVDDLLATSPRRVPIANAKIEATQVVVSGRRVWIFGALRGAAAPYQLPVLTIDVPSDPTVGELRGREAELGYAYPTATAFPAPDGSVWITHNDGALLFPTGRVTAPPSGALGPEAGDAGPDAGDASASPVTYPMHPIVNASPAAQLVASSGERLLLFRPPGLFNLVTAPATASAKAEPDAPIVPQPPALYAPRFAQGGDGVVLQALPVGGDVPADCNCSSRARAQWVLPNALATTLEIGQLADVESYSNPTAAGQCKSCAAYIQPSLTAWIDGKTAVSAAPMSDPDRGFTDVRVVTRDPLAAPEQKRSRRQPGEVPSGDFAADRVALTSAGGFAYLVLADPEGNQVDLSIYDPRCDAK